MDKQVKSSTQGELVDVAVSLRAPGSCADSNEVYEMLF